MRRGSRTGIGELARGLASCAPRFRQTRSRRRPPGQVRLDAGCRGRRQTRPAVTIARHGSPDLTPPRSGRIVGGGVSLRFQSSATWPSRSACASAARPASVELRPTPGSSLLKHQGAELALQFGLGNHLSRTGVRPILRFETARVRCTGEVPATGRQSTMMSWCSRRAIAHLLRIVGSVCAHFRCRPVSSALSSAGG